MSDKTYLVYVCDRKTQWAGTIRATGKSEQVIRQKLAKNYIVLGVWDANRRPSNQTDE